MNTPSGVPAQEPPQSGISAALQRLVVLQPGEMPVLLSSFATLFFVFVSSTMLRPVRDTMGITSGVENLPFLFWGTFVAMLAVQPIYGWLTSRFRRTVFLPWVYGFFTVNLLLFYLWFNVEQDHTWIARCYYVWVSVYNLFVVAVFWSLMADVFTREQAGRMFGFIAAGASTGGLVGPALGSALSVPLGTINLLLIAAGALALSLVFLGRVIAWDHRYGASSRKGAESERALGGSVWAAFAQVVKSPYLLGIAMFVFLVTWISTFLYLEQAAFVAKVFHSRDERTQFFARVDFWVQAFSLLTQVLIFGRLFKWVGLRVMIVSVPILMMFGYAAFAIAPIFPVLVGVLAVRRVGEYAITRPCRDSLFTVVTREEKYKAKSLIDTFVYRGGDATSASLYKVMTDSLGWGAAAVGWFGAAVAAVWLVLSYNLGKAQERARVASEGTTASGGTPAAASGHG
jgi:AAA family ATP:ADP antiporter